MPYSIKDLEHLSGIKAHTIRIWEQRYEILKPQRSQTNIRMYDDEDLKMVLNISLLSENGNKISNIAKMSAEEIQQAVITLTEKTYKFPEQVQALTLAMIDLDEDRFEKIISTNIMHYGFEKSMTNIVFPFLTRIGFLWQTGSINPAQEHFVSFLIRQKLIVATDGITAKRKENPKKFMLFLPEGEMHETGLLFSNYLIRSRGHKCIYLGQSLPLWDAKMAYDIYKPDYVVCIATTAPSQSEIQQYIDDLGSAFDKSDILLTGYQVVAQDLKLQANQQIINRVEDLIAFLEDLN